MKKNHRKADMTGKNKAQTNQAAAGIQGEASRRDFFKYSAALATAATISPIFSAEAMAASPQNEDAKTLDHIERTNSDAKRRILLKGGIVVSMDPKIGNLAKGDVLIEGKQIKEIGPDLSSAASDGKAIVIDAKD